MPAAVVPAAFQDIGEADDVGIDIGVRIDQRKSHAGLRAEMHHVGEAMLGKKRRHASAVRKVEFDEAEAFELFELGEARLFQPGIVVGVQVVDADNGAALPEQQPRDVEADEAGGAGDEGGLLSHAMLSARAPPL